MVLLHKFQLARAAKRPGGNAKLQKTKKLFRKLNKWSREKEMRR